MNSFIPILWLKALLPLVKGDTNCIITTISARVGSINDNRSGGWYSYRASKAALNMLPVSGGIEIISNSDVPAGSGLGGSGSLDVALLAALAREGLPLHRRWRVAVEQVLREDRVGAHRSAAARIGKAV